MLDAKAARILATEAALDIIADAAEHMTNPPELFIVDDDSGRQVLTLPFKDVVPC